MFTGPNCSCRAKWKDVRGEIMNVLKANWEKNKNSSTFHSKYIFSAPLNHFSINVILWYWWKYENWRCKRGKSAQRNGNQLKLEIDSKRSESKKTMIRGADDIRSSYRPLSVEIDYNFMKNSFLFFRSLCRLNFHLPSATFSQLCLRHQIEMAWMVIEEMKLFLYYFSLESLISISRHFCLSTSFETSKLDK